MAYRDTMIATKVLAGIGATATALGLALGLWPLSFEGTSCGVAWHGSNAAQASDLGATLQGSIRLSPDLFYFEHGCSDTRQPLAVGGGAAVLVGLGLLFTAAEVRPKANRVVDRGSEVSQPKRISS